ncbi:MAG: hypothetical protein NC320_08440 [Clostridium sp.]|nr:hypothetical protein [Clostridium sp.]
MEIIVEIILEFFSELLTDKKVPKIIRYIIITIFVGVIEAIFILVGINGTSKIAMPFCTIMSIIFFMIYICGIIKIHKS